MVGDIEIKVKPEQLIAKADEVTQRLNKLKAAFSQMDALVNGSKSYWRGQAGDAHREIYKGEREAVDEMLKRLDEHPADLRAIALNYIEGEALVTQISASLPSDALV